MVGVFLFVVGLFVLLGGIMAPLINPAIPGYASWPLGALGIILIFAAAWTMFMQLYRKTAANEALVKTGAGGPRVILDGGALILPVLHQVVPVSLETMKLEVERMGRDALITNDNLRVDVKAEFYIRVNPETRDILQAARSLGHKSVDANSVAKLVFEKLVSALRSVAAQKTLSEMHTDRKTFAGVVQELVKHELEQNGLLLETVTISRLDQTDPHGLSDENIFDAQGKKKITEITAAARVERNRLEKQAEQAMTQQNVATSQQVLALELQRAEAQSTQERDVANIQAERNREKQAFQIEQERAVREAEIAKELAVQAAGIERDRALIQREQERQETEIQRDLAIKAAAIERDKALIAREQEQQTADVDRAKAIEVAERLKQIAIAQQEAAQAAAERDALAARAEREKANQQILTVQATAQAERDAQTKLIGAKQVIEQDRIKREIDAQVAAFTEVKKAEAAQNAAAMEAAAQLRLAEAEAQSKEMVATGEQAQRMVEVNVERERVNVEAARVEVERKALENRQTFDRAAIEFEVSKLRIEADKDVQVAMAEALGQFMSRGNYNIYGDPQTMSAMFQQYSKGMNLGVRAEGFLESAPGPLKELLRHLGDNSEEVLAALMARVGNGNGNGNGHAAEPAVASVGAPAAPPADTPAADAPAQPAPVIIPPSADGDGGPRPRRK